MNRAFSFTSAAACLVAVFLSVGGHWVVLQSVAWASMFADFSQTDSWRDALAKTFNGQNPCQLCHKIREGRARESKTPPLVKWERLPEFIPQANLARLFLPELPAPAHTQFIPRPPSDFIGTPPKPPPRAG